MTVRAPQPAKSLSPDCTGSYVTAYQRLRSIRKERRDVLTATKANRTTPVRGEAAEAKALIRVLRHALMRLAAIPARTIAELDLKQRLLVAHQEALEPIWLLKPIVGSWLLMDYRRLLPSPAEEERLRAMLPTARNAV